MFTTKLKVGFADSDPGGILFYSNIFNYAHKAYEEMIDNYKLKRNYFFDREYVIPIIRAEAEYYKPILVHENITIKVNVARVENSSFELNYKFYGANRLLKAAVKTVHVFVKIKDFKKSKLTNELYKNLSANLS